MDIIERTLTDSIAVKQAILSDKQLQATINAVADKMVAALRSGGKVLWCGNGGSAADAQHLAAELSGRFYYDRQPLNSDALHCNTSFLTAVANDYGYDWAYARLLKGIAAQGDILVGISTSGNSQNIINAFEVAHEMGITTVAFTGKTGGKLAAITDFLINVPSTDTPRIQESHITIGHAICEQIEATIFPKS